MNKNISYLLLLLIFILSPCVDAAPTEPINNELSICNSNQHICLQMASKYFSNGKFEAGHRLLEYRARQGDMGDIYNYAHSLKEHDVGNWIDWMQIAAGLGDIEAQTIIIGSNNFNRATNKFFVSLLSTYEEDGITACLNVMTQAVLLKDDLVLLNALRRNSLFCMQGPLSAVVKNKLNILSLKIEKQLSSYGLVAWRKFQLTMSKPAARPCKM
jgi:hypothetical protein